MRRLKESTKLAIRGNFGTDPDKAIRMRVPLTKVRCPHPDDVANYVEMKLWTDGNDRVLLGYCHGSWMQQGVDGQEPKRAYCEKVYYYEF